MASPVRIGIDQRRARLAWRHHLAVEAQTGGPVEVTHDLVAIHSTDPGSVFLGMRARVPGLTVADLERTLYQERTLIRALGMRRTLFVMTPGMVPVIRAACTEAIAVRERQRVLQVIEQAGLADDPAAWLAGAEDEAMAALEGLGQAAATELSAVVPAFRQRVSFGAGRKWAGEFGMSTRILFQLAAESRIVRVRPRGTWISGQYRWAPMTAWLGADLATMPAGDARVELARHWLRAFGPGTIEDLRWWTGWTMRDLRPALSSLPVADVDLDGETGLVLADDLDRVEQPAPWVAFLPALDTTVMGWSRRDWYLGVHRAALFDTNGNAGPTVWWDGRVVGGWGQRPDATVIYRLLEDAGREATSAVEEEAGRLQRWLGSVRVTPRFRTPLEQELGAP
jgi:hypothetical protein